MSANVSSGVKDDGACDTKLVEAHKHSIKLHRVHSVPLLASHRIDT